MKPFLLLQIRPEDEASDNEYQAFLKHGKLNEEQLRRMRIERGIKGKININDYSGILIGGGPSNISDTDSKKSDDQKKFENDFKDLLDEIIKQDFPFLGVCYGIGALVNHQAGSVSKEKYAEAVGGVDIELTDQGKKDDLLKDLPSIFRAFVGHKEACQNVPNGVVLLASSNTCPVQMVRIKNNIYATQFHPELDCDGIILRINIYKHAGYFPPEDAEKLINMCRKETVTEPMRILRNFVCKYLVK